VATKGGNIANSGYIDSGPHTKDIAVVFVHGVFGDATGSWTGSGDSFPRLLADDPELKPLLDVFVFDYFSDHLRDSPSMDAIVSQLSETLSNERVFDDHREVLFLAHSMGGLIVRRFLIENQVLIPKVPLVFFYSTPSAGADIANVARLVSRNPQLSALIPLESNDLLQATETEWRVIPAKSRPTSFCAYETQPVDDVMIVSRSSADLLCDRASVGLNADHIQIVKPDNRRDLRYMVFVNALRDSAIPRLQPGVELTFENKSNKKSSTVVSLCLLKHGKIIASDEVRDHFTKDQINRVLVPASFTRDEIPSLSIRITISPGKKAGLVKQDTWSYAPTAIFISEDGKEVVSNWDVDKLGNGHSATSFQVNESHGHHERLGSGSCH
jgi:pimeloyl-ACP methyl ester carboxylesterase